MRRVISTGLEPEPAVLSAVCSACGLNGLRVGRHIVRDSEERRTGEFHVRKLWVARIGPPAAPPAYLATISTEAHSILVFSTVESERGEPLLDTLLLDAHRIDPVAGALEHLDVWTSGAGIPLGGYGYDLMVLTSQSEAVFHFGAKAPSFAGFRTALFEHGSLFQSRDTKPSTAQFLERWIAAL